MKKILAIIGLRSGSKSLKNKNIKNLNNKPLFTYIGNSASKSKLINRIIFSTDSTRYIKIIKKYGFESPYLRPKKFSKDSSDEIDFIKDLLLKLRKKENYSPDIIVRLLATCPFQKAEDIDNAIKLVLSKKYNSSVVISEAKQHPEKALKIYGTKKKFVGSYIDKNPLRVGSKLNRQSFKKSYVRSNVIVCNANIIYKYNSLTSTKPGFIVINKSLDIDDKMDFLFANFLVSKNIIS
jgi:CMP-N,N'-diacetyllegionaminic acid synthase